MHVLCCVLKESRSNLWKFWPRLAGEMPQKGISRDRRKVEEAGPIRDGLLVA